MMKHLTRLLAVAVLWLLAGCEPPTAQSVQAGYRGTGMIQVHNPTRQQEQAALNVAPEPLPKAEVPPETPTAGATFQNVRVLKDLSVPEFARLMSAITTWVSPKQGCVYCHAGADLADD